MAGRSVRGISTPDGDALWTHGFGEPVLCRSGVGQVTARLTAEFEVWQQRDLSVLTVVYLLLDAIYVQVRPQRDRQAVIVGAYGIREAGQKVLLNLALGSRAPFGAWPAFRSDRAARGWGLPC